MKAANLKNEIRELNLAYLMLAQQMLQDDREGAMLRLGVGEDIAAIIEDLSPGQILRMASSDMLLCRFRFDDTMLLNLLTSHERVGAAASIHATILAAAQPVEHLS